MVELRKREFLQLLGTGAFASALGYTTRETSSGENAIVGGLVDDGGETEVTVMPGEVKSIIVEQSIDDLSDPDSAPAIAITADEGLLIWSDSA